MELNVEEKWRCACGRTGAPIGSWSDNESRNDRRIEGPSDYDGF